MDDRPEPDDAGGIVLPSTPSSVSRARRYVAQACRAAEWAGDVDTVILLTSEVATNAVMHAYGPEIRVGLRVLSARVRVEVVDGSPRLPRPRRAPERAENGRGLELVDALAVHWGVDTHTTGKTLWFEVDA